MPHRFAVFNMKDYNSNKKYFTQKSPMPYHVIFVFVATVSAALICLGPRMYPIAFPLLFVGVIMEVTVCQRHVTDKYFEAFLPEEKQHFISEFEAIYQPTDDRLLHANAVGSPSLTEKHGKAIYGGEYRFLPSDFAALEASEQIRKGDDGVARSSVYCLTGMQIDPKRICLMTKRIGMTEKSEKIDRAAPLYADLESVSIETTTLSCDLPAAHCIEMVFYDKKGNDIFRLPIHGSYVDDERVDRINELIRKSAEGQ